MRSLIVGAVLVLATSSLASAESGKGAQSCVAAMAAGCACAAPIPASGSIGKLSDVTGNVLLATTAGFTPIRRTTGVNLGDQINVDAGGSASLSFGSCKLSLVGPQKVKVKVTDNCACAAFVPLTSAAAGSGAGAGAAILGGVAVAGGVGALVFTQGNNPASP